MRIQVIHRDGRKEILTVVAPPVVQESQGADGVSRLISAEALEHWFNDNDGTYDGWNRKVPGRMSDAEAQEEIEKVEAQREYVR